jgi:hypothetical protein
MNAIIGAVPAQAKRPAAGPGSVLIKVRPPPSICKSSMTFDLSKIRLARCC